MFNAALLNAIVSKRSSQKIRITTNAGVTLIAPISEVTIFVNLERLFALWDMRDGMHHDTHYNRSIPFSHIKTVEYVK